MALSPPGWPGLMAFRQTRAVLRDGDPVTEMVEHNYELGRRYYSYQALEKRLVVLVSKYLGD